MYVVAILFGYLVKFYLRYMYSSLLLVPVSLSFRCLHLSQRCRSGDDLILYRQGNYYLNSFIDFFVALRKKKPYNSFSIDYSFF